MSGRRRGAGPGDISCINHVCVILVGRIIDV